MGRERLQKLMAGAGLGSRRQNEALIAAGRLTVNGRLARLGDKADPEHDRIEFDGQPLDVSGAQLMTFALYKPRGVISSLKDELHQGRPTVRDLIPVPGHLYPIGRLDKPSEGLMLMTNNGKLAHRLTHPRYEHPKVYEVDIEGQVPAAALEAWRHGVLLDGRPTLPAEIIVISQNDRLTRLRIVLREGRKRQIRRTAATFDLTVRRLMRTEIGPIKLGNLTSGKWRALTRHEITALENLIQHKAKERNRS